LPTSCQFLKAAVQFPGGQAEGVYSNQVMTALF